VEEWKVTAAKIALVEMLDELLWMVEELADMMLWKTAAEREHRKLTALAALFIVHEALDSFALKP